MMPANRAAATLFVKGYKKGSALLDVGFASLNEEVISHPFAMELSFVLKDLVRL